ncbi:MAG: 30S ribosomal protein S27e [Candidatus Woesearchaeota archaeon]|nr:30S ribosomal protein S27e [Candidatus Woesearchaeota archaeon]
MVKFKEPSTKFMKVRCACKNEQIIFGKASSVVNCLVCGKPLATPTGGKAFTEARVLEVLD